MKRIIYKVQYKLKIKPNMSDFSYNPVYKRTPMEPATSLFSRRHSEPTSYYPSSSDLDPRSYAYTSYQPQLQEKKIFGFEIFIGNQILKELEPNDTWFATLTSEYQVESIKFNPDLGIPDLNGKNIQIYDIDMEKKYQCSKGLLYDVYQVYKSIKKQQFSIIIFVPQGMVSLLIGTKGHQINKIMRESYTKIVVNQPINKMTYRTAKIQGNYSDIAKACKMIYQILEQKSAIAYAIEKQPSQFDYTKAKIRTKFLFTYHVLKHLMKKKKSVLDRIEEETRCSISTQTDRRNHLIKEDEEVLIINGRLEDVQAYIVMLINLLHPMLSEDRKNVDYTIKLLIPANYVTKLIGQKGYMIKDIIERSGGAQIKILSDRQAQKDTKQCIISINGTIENKIDASCFILQQIECFKNGGPILQSGKSINQNLVQQFKNSIPLHNQSEKLTNEMEIEMNLDNNVPNDSAPLTPYNNPIQSQPSPVSPPIKHFSSVPPNKFQQQNDNKSEEEGLIEGESDQEKKKQEPEAPSQKQDKNKKVNSPSQKSKSKSSSISHRSRSRQKNRQRRQQSRKKRSRSKSSSLECKYDREYVEIKLLVPQKLAKDYRELEYIEGIGKSKITISDKAAQSPNEAIISIRGYVRDNTKTLRLLQKRISRYRSN